jgi:hypothetical protein
MADLDWKREFDALGVPGVRAALIGRRWDRDKRSAAREWLERSDAQAWQSTRPRGSGASAAAAGKSGMDVFRRYKWVYYILAGGVGLFALTQIIRF